jgi:hypothetical protein
VGAKVQNLLKLKLDLSIIFYVVLIGFQDELLAKKAPELKRGLV